MAAVQLSICNDPAGHYVLDSIHGLSDELLRYLSARPKLEEIETSDRLTIMIYQSKDAIALTVRENVGERTTTVEHVSYDYHDLGGEEQLARHGRQEAALAKLYRSRPYLEDMREIVVKSQQFNVMHSGEQLRRLIFVKAERVMVEWQDGPEWSYDFSAMIHNKGINVDLRQNQRKCRRMMLLKRQGEQHPAFRQPPIRGARMVAGILHVKVLKDADCKGEDSANWGYVPAMPSNMVIECFNHNHQGRLGRHRNYYQTLREISTKSWWPDMNEQIRRLCESCEWCRKKRQEEKQRKDTIAAFGKATRTHDVVVLAFSETKKTCNGELIVMTATDEFSK